MRNFVKNNENIVTGIIIAVIEVICSVGIAAGTFMYYGKFYIKENKMAIEVLDKKHESYYTYNMHRKKMMATHKYYLLWEEGKIKISKSVYDHTEIGDRIVIIKSITYYKKDNSIYDISYKYGGDE